MPGDSRPDPGWTNPSVQLLSPGADPLATVSTLVTDLLLSAADEGVVGSPTDPFQLAALMGIGLRPHFDIADARLVAEVGDAAIQVAPLARFVPSTARLFIEYNPTRPRGRLRFSVAHELAHGLFPDAGEETRHRSYSGAVEDLAADDSWELELLCNVAAAEILMPTAAIEGLLNTDTDIDFLMAKRAHFHVSTEALLRRLVHATDKPMALAALHRVREDATSTLRCDYVLTSRAWTGAIDRGTLIDPENFPTAPSAVGQTTRGAATIEGRAWNVQTVGAPPYPGRALPRVLALVEPLDAARSTPTGLVYKAGDIAEAVEHVTDGAPTVIAHVVNDGARAWSRYGVAGALARAIPDAAAAFRSWALASPDNLVLGNVHTVAVRAANGAQVTVASLVAQAGYGPSAVPRLSYVKLAEALDVLAEAAVPASATVHMPRLGAGQAGGRWDLIEAAVERSLLARGVPVIVYTLPAGQDSARGRA